MPESVAAGDMARVAVYLDFDNIVISRYDQVHGRNSFQKDKARGLENDNLTKATVDVGAIIDFASSFGTLVLTRAYADWSADLNPGDSIDTAVVFDVPVGTDPEFIELHDGPFSEGVTVGL